MRTDSFALELLLPHEIGPRDVDVRARVGHRRSSLAEGDASHRREHLIRFHRIAQRNSNLVELSRDHGGHVRRAVRIELHLCGRVYASDELLGANRFGSNAATFEARLRDPDHA